jgi:hypothetical protein
MLLAARNLLKLLFLRQNVCLELDESPKDYVTTLQSKLIPNYCETQI